MPKRNKILRLKQREEKGRKNEKRKEERKKATNSRRINQIYSDIKNNKKTKQTNKKYTLN